MSASILLWSSLPWNELHDFIYKKNPYDWNLSKYTRLKLVEIHWIIWVDNFLFFLYLWKFSEVKNLSFTLFIEFSISFFFFKRNISSHNPPVTFPLTFFFFFTVIYISLFTKITSSHNLIFLSFFLLKINRFINELYSILIDLWFDCSKKKI